MLAGEGDETWRIWVTGTPRNKITLSPMFPVPWMGQLLYRLCNSAVSCGAFFHIRINPDDWRKSAFLTRMRKLQYACRPLGPMNAPSELQRQVKRGDLRLVNESWRVLDIP